MLALLSLKISGVTTEPSTLRFHKITMPDSADVDNKTGNVPYLTIYR
jgi:hypothetical protein